MCEECVCARINLITCEYVVCECMHVIIMTVYIILLCTSIYGIVDTMTLYFLLL